MRATETTTDMTQHPPAEHSIVVRLSKPTDVPALVALSAQVYPMTPWGADQLLTHQRLFPQGQFVAQDARSGRVVGMAASLIVRWDDYDLSDSWRDFTETGYFTNHDPEQGRTLYGAEVMVDPSVRGMGIGKKIYAARRDLVHSLGLLRIRAGARLRGYGQFADRMPADAYVEKVVHGEMGDPTLSFQLKQGFRVLAVVSKYIRQDPESRGFAAVIEWLNPHIATPEDYHRRDPRFAPGHPPLGHSPRVPIG